MNADRRSWWAWAGGMATVLLGAMAWAADPAPGESPPRDGASFSGALLSVEQATEGRLAALRDGGVNAIVLPLGSGESRDEEDAACDRVRRGGLDLYYWIEVARCRELADAHPAWMASLQGHSQWRRLFKEPPRPSADEVVKNYPWVPVLNREAFDGQFRRVRRLLKDRPPCKGVFLNDLQGAPSACGCGNLQCRWTSDYGKIRTATPLGNDAPARFVEEVRALLPETEVIPVWTTECERHDGARDGKCAGVGCFDGICWRAYTEQLVPVLRKSSVLAVLLPYRAFQRDSPAYGEEAGWIAHAVRTFQRMPPQHGGRSIPPERLLAVLQGWEVSEAQVSRQIDVARRAGVRRVLVAWTKIDQDWEPKLFKWK